VHPPPRVDAICLAGRERLERLILLPALAHGRREAELYEAMEQDRDDASILEDAPMEARRFR
jgi:hypothetical protein